MLKGNIDKVTFISFFHISGRSNLGLCLNNVYTTKGDSDEC